MLEGLDIDWFLIDSSELIWHFASGGGFVPDIINESIVEASKSLLMMPEISPIIVINRNLHDFVEFNTTQDYEMYVESFVKYAKRGLYSYDKSVLNDYEDPFYHLVASPTHHLRPAALPPQIRNLLPVTSCSFNSLTEKQVNARRIIFPKD